MEFRSLCQTPAIARLARQIRIAHYNAQSWRIAARQCQIWTAHHRINPGLAKHIADGWMPSQEVIDRLRNDGALVFCEDQAPTLISDMTEAQLITALQHRQPMPDHVDPKIVQAFVKLGWLQPEGVPT